MWLLLIAVLATLAWPARIAYRAYRDERACFTPRQHAPRLGLPEFGVPGAAEVKIPAENGAMLRGYFAPSSNGAAIVLAHGSNGERSDLSPEARLLSAAGFGVLAFDFPGHGQSEGRVVEWSGQERRALRRAVDWLQKQPSVEAQRIGVFGFSMGGYIALQTASEDPRLRAVAAASSPHDPLQHLAWEYRRFGFLSRLPALLALRNSGMDTESLVPERVIARIAPRPLLLISGREDQLVPRWMTDRLYEAAREPKQLLVVERAGHGGFTEAEPERYGRELSTFFAVLLR
jgi:dipeptidyl aminopeptidase/acylaminoacyl peptidase